MRTKEGKMAIVVGGGRGQGKFPPSPSPCDIKFVGIAAGPEIPHRRATIHTTRRATTACDRRHEKGAGRTHTHNVRGENYRTEKETRGTREGGSKQQCAVLSSPCPPSPPPP
jgi:hypothetical protein